jgi:hypothetical protein
MGLLTATPVCPKGMGIGGRTPVIRSRRWLVLECEVQRRVMNPSTRGDAHSVACLMLRHCKDRLCDPSLLSHYLGHAAQSGF